MTMKYVGVNVLLLWLIGWSGRSMWSGYTHFAGVRKKNCSSWADLIKQWYSRWSLSSVCTFWIYNDLKSSKIGGMLRAQLKLESLLGRRSGKFVMKESNQGYAEFISDFGCWRSWVTEVFLRSCCLPTQTYQNHCKVHVVAEIIANTSWKKTSSSFT